MSNTNNPILGKDYIDRSKLKDIKDIEIDKNIDYKKSNKKLVHENYLCTWIGKPKK